MRVRIKSLESNTQLLDEEMQRETRHQHQRGPKTPERPVLFRLQRVELRAVGGAMGGRTSLAGGQPSEKTLSILAFLLRTEGEVLK